MKTACPLSACAFAGLLLAAATAVAAPPAPAPRAPARPPLAPATPAAPTRPAASAEAAVTSGNLCWNGSFDAEKDPLDGWMYDYQWEGNSHYMANHTRISVLPSHGGRSGVLCINGASAETKVESKPIKFEPGARYRCSLLLQGTAPHIYFSGYKWVPGMRPNDDPHLGDLRKIYKSEFRNHQITGGPGGWKRVSFEFPLPNASELALKHLKEVRYLTVYMVVVDTEKGVAYIDDVEVKRIQ